MPPVETRRRKRGHDRPGDRRLQAKEDCQFDNHVNLFARRPANVSTSGRHGNPFAPDRAEESVQ
jgi:hypothetical protein